MKNKIAIFLLIFFCNFLLMESAISKNYKTGTVIEDEFYITKNFRLPLSEGKWVVVRKEHFIFSGGLQEIVGIAKVENNELLELIEVYRGLLAGFYESTINNAINAIVFKDPYDGCYQRPEYYIVDVFSKGSTHNCFVVRHIETNKELKDGTLFLNVSHGDQLAVEYSKNDILAKINSFFGYEFIKQIRLILVRDKKKKKSIQLKKNPNSDTKNKIGKVDDNKLKKKLEGLIDVYVSRKKI